MKVVLWDTRRNDVQKDFAGGMGVGMHPGTGGWRGKIVRHLYKQDYRPVAMNFAYLAAIVKKLGHQVEYSLDDTPAADVYIFNPALQTVDAERNVMRAVRRQLPEANILVVGQVAFAMADSFAGLGVTVVKGEAEQLLFRWDEVLGCDQEVIDVGTVADLDQLPVPDWSLFKYKKFRIKYDFHRFPSTYIQQSRGCTFKCNYCPYIMIESKTRFRDPESVVDEIRFGVDRYGFESFKFRDPLFGLNRKKALEVAEGIRKLDRSIQFSVETRVDLMKEDTLRALKAAGLTSITIGIETPDEETLRRYSRVAINDDRQRDFVALCRSLGIRTVAGFMVGFPDDNADSIRHVLNYARAVNPTYANFNIVTPYPGTAFHESVKDQIAEHDLSKYTVYHPVMQYNRLTADQVSQLHGECFTKFYFRSRYLQDNALLLWPGLRRFAAMGKKAVPASPENEAIAGGLAADRTAAAG